MNRMIPMVLLVVGLGLAAASGARNGASHVSYRQAVWTAEGADAAPEKAEAQRYLDEVGLPVPRQRLSEWFSEGGLGWGLGVLMILGGAIMARRQAAADFAGGPGGAAMADFVATLTSLRSEVEHMQAALKDVPMEETAPEVRERLDKVQLELIGPLVDARGQFMARHGVAKFAEYFSPFSGGERNLNRCWSALTDGHVVVARQALVVAADSFRLAVEAWERAEAKS
jgi:hypothetical protein